MAGQGRHIACAFDPATLYVMADLRLPEPARYDGDDREVLERLLDHAIDTGDRAEIAALIERLRVAPPERSWEVPHAGNRESHGALVMQEEAVDATDFVELLDT